MKKILILCLTTMVLSMGGFLFTAIRDVNAAVRMITDTTQAVARAKFFFNDVGWKTSGNTQFKSSAENKIQPDTWVVNDEKTAVFCNESTGIITFASHPRVLTEEKKDTVSITLETAKYRSKTYILAAGLQLNEVKFVAGKLIKEQNASTWQITYQKLYQGYASLSGNIIIISLNPIDGSLITFRCQFSPFTPENTQIAVNKSTAVKNAGKFLKNLKYKPGKLVSANLLIVQPDNYWQKIKPEGYQQRQAFRLAWVIKLDAPWGLTELWVDAEDGTIIGGVHCRCMAGLKPNIRKKL